MLIYVKNIKKKKKLFTDGQTDGQPKTIVRKLTKEKKKKSEYKRANQKVKLYKFIVFLTGV